MTIKHEVISAAEFTKGGGKNPHFGAAQLEQYGCLLVTIDAVGTGKLSRAGSSKEDPCKDLHCHTQNGNKLDPIAVTARCNRVFLFHILGGTSTKDWPGRQIWIYHDPTAEYGGKTVGGIRFAWGDEYSGQLEKRRDSQPTPPRPPKPTPIPNGQARPSKPLASPLLEQVDARPEPQFEPPPEAYDPDTGEVGPAELREPGQEG